MVLVVYFLPEGIVPAIRKWWEGRQHEAAAHAAPESATTEAAR
jgi:hypothetical protein